LVGGGWITGRGATGSGQWQAASPATGSDAADIGATPDAGSPSAKML
jgi:hypothetical protein